MRIPGSRGWHFVYPERIPLAMTLVMLTVLMSLGTWQLERLKWKQALIQRIEQNTTAPPAAPPGYLEGYDRWLEYRRVQVSGVMRHDREVPIYAIGPDGTPGYHIYTPLVRDGNQGTVLINRGWVPEKLKHPQARDEGLAEGRVTIVGLLRLPQSKRFFTPDNRPAENQWYWPDLRTIANQKKLDRFLYYTLDALADPDAPAPPRGGATRLNIRNNHFEYALTWFGLAGILTIIFLMVHIRRPE